MSNVAVFPHCLVVFFNVNVYDLFVHFLSGGHLDGFQPEAIKIKALANIYAEMSCVWAQLFFSLGKYVGKTEMSGSMANILKITGLYE